MVGIYKDLMNTVDVRGVVSCQLSTLLNLNKMYMMDKKYLEYHCVSGILALQLYIHIHTTISTTRV